MLNQQNPFLPCKDSAGRMFGQLLRHFNKAGSRYMLVHPKATMLMLLGWMLLSHSPDRCLLNFNHLRDAASSGECYLPTTPSRARVGESE